MGSKNVLSERLTKIAIVLFGGVGGADPQQQTDPKAKLKLHKHGVLTNPEAAGKAAAGLKSKLENIQSVDT